MIEGKVQERGEGSGKKGMTRGSETTMSARRSATSTRRRAHGRGTEGSRTATKPDDSDDD
eukprot:CAMPEP_0202445438 /NCGR_PEP_ID=MMETSP1360-20130828/4266_1 /ASSEMBLY_ACC=CAM_ASM_000848 /TAXON_ID=515479 /ORGANISM="Licmophora paradoxa, Strain CCMP2313" /LENGTH=59 /DNA_ID=CAMNT_0049061713 /DNA_START=330 /DNA_END=506 /DNA_ORIENTATION=-